MNELVGDLTFGAWLRTVFAIGSVGITIALFIQTLKAFKYLSIGQKLWSTGTILLLIYISDALRRAIQINLEWSFRLIPLMLGLIAFFVYLFEPQRQKRQRFGGEVLAPREEHRPIFKQRVSEQDPDRGSR